MAGETHPGMIKLLTAAQVCDIFGISRNTLRRWVAARRIPYLQIGREYRFAQVAIEKLIERRTVKPI